MLTIRCNDVMAIRNDLAVYVSDQLGAVPLLKNSEFVLSPVDDEPLDKELAVTAIREYLQSMGEDIYFVIAISGDKIFIKSKDGHVIETTSRPNPGMYSCPHCGFLTQYETEYHIHMKIHYL